MTSKNDATDQWPGTQEAGVHMCLAELASEAAVQGPPLNKVAVLLQQCTWKAAMQIQIGPATHLLLRSILNSFQ